MADTLTDRERFPLLTDEGRALLKRLREHPHAPRYTAQCGNRLTADHLRRVRAYEAQLGAAARGWPAGAVPDWLPGFVEACFRDVPFYRRYGAPPKHIADVPPAGRADLSREVWSFVPDSQPLDDLILYATSGTSGHPLRIPSHPVVGACYTPLIKAALEQHGVALDSGRGQVACILVGWQRRSYTYPSVTPHQDDAGHLKLNLHPDDWRAPDDRARFLDDCNAEIYTGDPLAFAELLKLPLKARPRALVSTAMKLLPGLRRQLESHFACPVIDLYSMNETGPIAAAAGANPDEPIVWRLLQPRLYVEILDDDGLPCPAGARGEVVVTGGLNFLLPLLRYRTGDFASLEWRGGEPVLVDLEGRRPVLLRGAGGQALNNLDVTNALSPLALPQFALHQYSDGTVGVRVRSDTAASESQVRQALLGLFDADQIVAVELVDSLGDKTIQYTTDLPPAPAGPHL